MKPSTINQDYLNSSSRFGTRKTMLKVEAFLQGLHTADAGPAQDADSATTGMAEQTVENEQIHRHAYRGNFLAGAHALIDPRLLSDR